ncbi:recombinase family protein [Yersinia massiliensis]|nr:recombinase family protein [Yersinia massiliensis]MCB5320358.1 recombinase family protein [Yersinia massiliensis]
MTMFVRAYLRASTSEQDAQRARDMLDRFAHEHNVVICNYYAENESGAHLDRPELFRLLNDSRAGDVLLIEDVDRLSRLKGDEWEKLKAIIRQRGVWVVAVNVPTTWQHLSPKSNEFDNRMFAAINDMLLDMLAAIARRDYEQRRERQQQGIIKAKAAGKYRGRQINKARYDAINRLLLSGSSWSQVQKTIGCSRSTISSAIKYAERQNKVSPLLQITDAPAPLSMTLFVSIENGSKFTRGKKKTRELIDWFIEAEFDGQSLGGNEYRMPLTAENDEQMKEQVEYLFSEINMIADVRNCLVIDCLLTNDQTGLGWDDCAGCWQ